jgi:hypothetical protein
VANAALGGAASVAGGGKFANGAITGSFGYLANFQGSAAAWAASVAGDGFIGSALSAIAGPLAGVIAAATPTSTAGPEEDEFNQFVVRGGEAKWQDLQNGTALTQNGFGFSVQTAPGVGIDELARGDSFPNASVSWATVQQLEAIPGVTVNFPTPGFGDYHGTVNIPDPPPPGIFNAISGVFNRTPNPYRVPR